MAGSAQYRGRFFRAEGQSGPASPQLQELGVNLSGEHRRTLYRDRFICGDGGSFSQGSQGGCTVSVVELLLAEPRAAPGFDSLRKKVQG
jgi:hypothetical protein